MLVLEKHYLNKTTLIFDEYIINGCATFKINDLIDNCIVHRVPRKYMLDVEKQFKLNQNNIKGTGEEYNNIINLPFNIKRMLASINEYRIARLLIEENSTLINLILSKHNIIEILNKLMFNDDPAVRYQVAKHPNKEILKHLINDEIFYVREQAINTLNKLQCN